MTEIAKIDGYEDGSGKVVVVGDEKATNQISFQLAQAFYNEITGKSERLRELYSDPFILKLNDVEQLYHRLVQSTEQYNISAFHESYTVNYVDDSSERFSSLQRLKLHNGAKGVAVEEIIISYCILIVLPKSNRPQEYKITVKLASRVAKIEEMRKQVSSMPFEIPLYQLENANAASFSIDYVDSTVANALMSVIKSWFNTVEKNSISSMVKIARSLSHFVPRITKYGLLSMVCFSVWQLSNTFLVQDVHIKTATLFTLLSVLAAFLSVRLGMFTGKRAEIALDSIYEQSYINFSGADENFVKMSSDRIRKSKIKALFNLVCTITIGIGCSLLADWIGS